MAPPGLPPEFDVERDGVEFVVEFGVEFDLEATAPFVVVPGRLGSSDEHAATGERPIFTGDGAAGTAPPGTLPAVLHHATPPPPPPRRDRALSESSPPWWGVVQEPAWQRWRHALARDWRQTKADLGMPSGAPLGQRLGDTIAQLAGPYAVPPLDEPVPLHDDEIRQALRFGFAAARSYIGLGWRLGPEGPDSQVVMARLRHDWDALGTGLPWARVEFLVVHGYVEGVHDRRG